MSSITKKVRVPDATARTKVSYNRSGSESLKVTIPENIVELMKVKAGDIILWQLDKVNNEIFCTVEKEEKKE